MAGRGRTVEDKVAISIGNYHDYVDAMEVCVEANERLLEECSTENQPVTPSKVHITKKVRPDSKEDLSNADIYSISKIFNKQEDMFEELARKMEENCNTISEMKGEMKAHKQKAAELELELSDIKKENKELISRIGELDRHKRRRNARIKGQPEKQNENSRGGDHLAFQDCSWSALGNGRSG